MNSAEVRERTYKRPEIVRRGKEGAGEIEDRYLVGNGGENGYDSGGGSVGSVIEFDTLEVWEGQASTGGCFENGRGDVSGVVADNSLLIMGQKAGGGLGELVERIDLLRGVETDGAETMETSGRKPIPSCESTGVERLGIVVKVVDDLVNEL